MEKENTTKTSHASKTSGSSATVQVAIVMGSLSDYETMKHAEDILKKFNIPYTIQIVSAHRTPERMYDFAKDAQKNGFKIIIAGAGGAAHLPGMLSALTLVPVLGVPVASQMLRGVDSLLSIVQMPKGVPTATFAIGPSGATNAALFAAQILAMEKTDLLEKLQSYRSEQKSESIENSNNLMINSGAIVV